MREGIPLQTIPVDLELFVFGVWNSVPPSPFAPLGFWLFACPPPPSFSPPLRRRGGEHSPYKTTPKTHSAADLRRICHAQVTIVQRSYRCHAAEEEGGSAKGEADSRPVLKPPENGHRWHAKCRKVEYVRYPLLLSRIRQTRFWHVSFPFLTNSSFPHQQPINSTLQHVDKNGHSS